MRRRVFAPLLLALLIAGPSAAQPTTNYSRLYVFGDSYSDIGAGYVDGNGPTAVAYLAWLMGLQVAPGKAAGAADKSLVFAVSGAGTGEGEGRAVKDARLGYGMLEPGARLRRAGEGRRDHVRSATRRCSSWPAGSTTAGRRRRHARQSPATAQDLAGAGRRGTSPSRGCRRRSRSSRRWGGA